MAKKKGGAKIQFKIDKLMSSGELARIKNDQKKFKEGINHEKSFYINGYGYVSMRKFWNGICS